MSVKLIDILVQELPSKGGWPEWATECLVHDGCYGVVFYDADGCFSKYPNFPKISIDWKSSNEIKATREQYEAALAASKPEWDGEGFPPVGCECEALYDSGRNQWLAAKILAHDGRKVVGRWIGGDSEGDLLDYSEGSLFRPICSEADKKKEEAVFAIAELCRQSASNGHSAELIYDAIKSGKIVID